MKKSIKELLLLTLALQTLFFFNGCSEKENLHEEESLVENIQDDSLLKILSQWGYDNADIVDKGSYYLVEGDIVFLKGEKYLSPEEEYGSNKNVFSKSSGIKQKRYPIMVNNSDINVYINPTMSLLWRIASSDAIDKWNLVNSSLKLTPVSIESEAHIKIMYDIHDDPSIGLLKSSVIGKGEWPTYENGVGIPGKKIRINPDSDFELDCGKPLLPNDKVAIVQHELGHTLGLMHTDTSKTPPEAFLIPGTNEIDSESLMNKGSCETIHEFSSYDEIAIAYLFPLSTSSSPLLVSIDGPFFANNSSYYTWTASATDGTAPYTYSWFYSNNQGQTYIYPWGQGGSSVTVQMPNGQDLYIKVIATDSNGNTGEEEWMTTNTGGGWK